MYENPLLPNRKLQELYALMQRARRLALAPEGSPRFEAILAASVMHLEEGDFVSPPLGAPAAATFAAEYTQSTQPVADLPRHQRLATAAGIAHGLLLAGRSRLAVVYTDAGPATVRSEQGWQEALTYAAKSRLPLIVICADVATSRRSKADPGALTYDAMVKLATPLHLPVLSVDGADAVAVYRVMQESVLRGRTLGGTAVIWCSLPAASAKQAATGAQDPLVHMRRYLADRKLLPQKSKPVASRKA